MTALVPQAGVSAICGRPTKYSGTTDGNIIVRNSDEVKQNNSKLVDWGLAISMGRHMLALAHLDLMERKQCLYASCESAANYTVKDNNTEANKSTFNLRLANTGTWPELGDE